MPIIGAFGDSNKAPQDGNMEANTGDGGLGTLGYTQIPFPKEMPARKNSDIKDMTSLSLSRVNQGTSYTSYEDQDETISAEDGGGESEEVSGMSSGSSGHLHER